MQSKQYDVFLCSSRQDSGLTTTIESALANAGISSFSDHRDFKYGNFEDEIVSSIQSSKLVIFICTSHSIQSNWVMSELLYAYQQYKHIIPIIVDDTDIPTDLNRILARFQQFYVRTNTFMSDIQNTISTVKSLLEKNQPDKIQEIGPSLSEEYESEKDERYSSSKGMAEESEKSKGKIDIKRILLIILYAVFGFVVIYYAFHIYSINNTPSGIRALYRPVTDLGIVIVIFGIILVWLSIRLRKFELKLYCEAEDDTESTLIIRLDDEVVSTVKGEGLVRLKERKSNSLISIDSDNPEYLSERFTYKFSRKNDGDVKQVILKKKISDTPSQAGQSVSDITIIRCFIAGSTRLVNERNATRAVLSILYNKWEKHNLVMSSYTFEDFSNSYSIGGQQIQYNDFIKEKATCAIFIVTENVGEKTLEEYRLAVNTFKENHIHPKIFVYANNLSDSDITKLFIEEVRKNNSYWRDYDSIKQLMSLVKEDVDSELFNIFIFKKGYNSKDV